MNRRRLGALAMGVVFAAALAEAALRIVGHSHQLPAPAGVDGKKFVIACLGNSFTAGTGAARGFSYCDFLQREADSARPQTVEVVNLGLPCLNSSQVLDRATLEFKRLRPNLVLAMVGEPNNWNRVGMGQSKHVGFLTGLVAALDRWLFGWRLYRFMRILPSRMQGDEPAAGRSLMFPELGLDDPVVLGQQWIRLLEDLSVYAFYEQGDSLRGAPAREALAALSALETETKTKISSLWKARLLAFLEEHAEAVREYERLLGREREYQFEVDRDLSIMQLRRPGVLNNAYGKLNAIIARRRPADYARMHEYFVFAEREYVRNSHWPATGALANVATADRAKLLDRWSKHTLGTMRFGLTIARAHLALGRPAAAISALEEFGRQNPRGLAHEQAFIRSLMISGDEEVSRRARQLEAKVEGFGETLEANQLESREELAHWIESDLRQIVALGRSYGAEVVLQTYPPYRYVGYNRLADHAARRVARETGVPLFDTRNLLAQYFSSVNDKDSYYSNQAGPKDQHLNEKGYGWVGRELWRFLSSERRLVP